MEYPKNEAVLLSVLNTKLRDCYESLSSLCDDLEWDEAEIVDKMNSYGYIYDENGNKFVPRA